MAKKKSGSGREKWLADVAARARKHTDKDLIGWLLMAAGVARRTTNWNDALDAANLVDRLADECLRRMAARKEGAHDGR